jgi:hypothetical protein
LSPISLSELPINTSAVMASIATSSNDTVLALTDQEWLQFSLEAKTDMVWGVAMLMKNFGHPDPKINSHHATEIGLRFVRRPPRTGPFWAACSGYHHDFTA